MNSREKGKRGERLWRDELRAAGYLKATRGAQHSGSPDSPDVLCPELPRIHFEVKFTESLNVRLACDQAARDAGRGKMPLVAHKSSRTGWLVTMPAWCAFQLFRNGAEIISNNEEPCAPPN